jgi:dCMP deaminase
MKEMSEKEASKHIVYMRMAQELASLSKATRLRVAAFIMNDGRILSCGYNGTPAGFPNEAEYKGKTVPTVVHAECNAICYAAKYGVPTDGTTLVVTHSPCMECAKLILQAGIKRIVFHIPYRDLKPIDFLREGGVEIFHIQSLDK